MRWLWGCGRGLFLHVAHVGVVVMHGRRRITRWRSDRLLLIVTIRQCGHLMRQTACSRYERRQRRDLKQDPRARENPEMPADKSHLQPDQLNEPTRSTQLDTGFP